MIKDKKNLTGLTAEEVSKKKLLGLSNQTIDSFSPTVGIIIARNTFNLINIILVPLLITLLYYKQYKDIFAFSTFAIINTITSVVDELRIKNQLEKLKSKFKLKAVVIRDGKEEEIPIDQIVEGDLIKAKNGDSIVSDGTIVTANYLQIDESALTGESNYVHKEDNDELLSGSFIVTGECIYEVSKVGKNNYLNKLGTESLKYNKKKSSLQLQGEIMIVFLVVVALTLALLNFYFTGLNNLSNTDRILSLTTIVVLLIPQTLIFLFTLSFSISITKLYNRGVLVQRGSSIDELSKINVICFDKTGTLTTNEMELKYIKYFNLKEESFGSFYNSVKGEIISINKTQEVINQKYSKEKLLEVSEINQIPFISKNKYSLITAKVNNEYRTIVIGAYSSLKNEITSSLKEEIEPYIKEEEEKGYRVISGFTLTSKDPLKIGKLDSDLSEILRNIKVDNFVTFSIEEKLNPGINEIIAQLQSQGIEVKIITGDSTNSVKRILDKVGLKGINIFELNQNKDTKDFNSLVLEYNVFTRSRPEDKLKIIEALKAQGKKVAMIGDGINDVLGMKISNASISMESGAKIAREISDIVLLENDYKKIPFIFYEGDNIIFNLNLATKIFLLKSFFAMILGLYFTFFENNFPLLPSSTLVFSFLGSSIPSYILIFTRKQVKSKLPFYKDVFISVIPSALIFASICILFYKFITTEQTYFFSVNTSLTMLISSLSIVYAVYFLWRSGKITNFFYAILIYLFLFFIGILETILPINFTQYGITNLMIALVLGIVSLIVFIVLRIILKPKNILENIIIFLVIMGSIAALAFFPFNTYYSLETIPSIAYIFIFMLTAISVTLSVVLDKITGKIVRLLKII